MLRKCMRGHKFSQMQVRAGMAEQGRSYPQAHGCGVLGAWTGCNAFSMHELLVLLVEIIAFQYVCQALVTCTLLPRIANYRLDLDPPPVLDQCGILDCWVRIGFGAESPGLKRYGMYRDLPRTRAPLVPC